MSITGAREVIAAFEGMKVKSSEASIVIVKRSEVAVEAEIKKGFTQAHQRGTPTPAGPGEPPAVITGTLRRSIVSSTPEPLRDGGAEGKVYPTEVYSRIQELGGGRGLPPRPYVEPAHERSKEILRAIAMEEWRRSARG